MHHAPHACAKITMHHARNALACVKKILLCVPSAHSVPSAQHALGATTTNMNTNTLHRVLGATRVAHRRHHRVRIVTIVALGAIRAAENVNLATRSRATLQMNCRCIARVVLN